MTPQERIQALNDRIKAGSITILQLTMESGYQGVWHALKGVSNPSAVNLDKMEQAVGRLEGRKDK